MQWNNIGGLPTNAGSAMSPISSSYVNERGMSKFGHAASNTTVPIQFGKTHATMLTSGGGTVNRARGAFSPGTLLLNNPSDGNLIKPNILSRPPG